MNPSHQDSQLMRNSDTASDQWSMSGLTTHCPSQARAKTDNSDGKMTQKLSQTVQIKTDSKIVLKFPISQFPHNYHAVVDSIAGQMHQYKERNRLPETISSQRILRLVANKNLGC